MMAQAQWLLAALASTWLDSRGSSLAESPTKKDCSPVRGLTPHHCCSVRVFPAVLTSVVGECHMEGNRICENQCLFKRTGMFSSNHNGDKTLNWVKIRELFKHNDEQLQPVISHAIKKCQHDYNRIFHILDSANHCDSDATDFIYCFSRQVFLNCPENYQILSTGCAKLRLQINQCPEIKILL